MKIGADNSGQSTTHDTFITTSSRGLRQDILDWQGLKDAEKESLLHLTALFQAGEECVTLDLLPLVMVIAQEGRLEEEMFLTTFLWEEAKHTEFSGVF